MERTAFFIRCGVGAAFGLAVSLVVVLACYFGVFGALDSATLDALFRVRGPRPASSDVVLVTIDSLGGGEQPDATAGQRWLAVLDRIAAHGPDAVVCFGDPFHAEADSAEEAAALASEYASLRAMLDRVVVAAPASDGLPASMTTRTPWRHAHSHLNADEDAVVRTVTAVQTFGANELPAAGIEAAAAAYGVSRVEPAVRGGRTVSYGHLRIPVDDDGRMLINYAGPPNTFETISGDQVVHNAEVARRCRGRVVLVAPAKPDGDDSYGTPYSAPNAAKMTALEIQGNVAATVLGAAYLAQTGRSDLFWGLIAVGLLFGAALPNLRAADKVVLTVGLLAIAGGVSYVLFAFGAFFLPVAPLMAVMGVSYVVVSVHEVVRANALVNRETEMLLRESAARRSADVASTDPDAALLTAMHALCFRLPLLGCAVAFPRYRDKGNVVAFCEKPRRRARGAFLRRSDVGMWEVMTTGRTVLLQEPEDSATRALDINCVQAMYVPLEIRGEVAAVLALYQERNELLTEGEVQVARMTMEQAIIGQQRRHLFATIQAPRRTAGPFSDENLEQRLAMLSAIRSATDDERAVAEAVLSSVTDGVLMFNLAGELVTWNPTAREMLDMSSEEMTALDFASFMTQVSESDADESARTAVSLLSEGTTWTTEMEMPESGRSYVITANRVVGRHDKPLGIVAVIQDVTHFKETARMKDELMSIATHELRTPLTSILGYAELLADDEVDPDTARKSAEVIYRQANHLSAMIDDFLDVSRIESGREELHLEAVDVLAVAQQCLAALSPAAESKNIETNAVADEPLPLAQADRRKLERIFNNLIGNAIKYSPEGGRIDVSITSSDGYVSVSVRDTGYGIPKQELSRIFEKFYRVRDRNTRDIRGTGLGLPLVRLIVESHGGDVSVDSEVGKGSTFTFTIPVSEAQAAETAAG